MIWNVLSVVWAIFLLSVVLGLGLMIRLGFHKILHRVFGLKDSRGVASTPTLLARAGYGTLPIDADIVARFGSGATPRRTLNLTILRPTLGLRAISLVLSTTVLVLVWFGPPEFLPNVPYIREVLTILVALGVLSTTIQEVRYDDRSVEVSGFGRARREYLWDDLISVRDNGHYELILTFTGKRKARVFKHLVGIRDFLTIAHMYSEINHRT